MSRIFPNASWKQIERALLVVGVLGAFAALATGDTAEHLAHPNRQLVEAHSTFAAVATWLYCVLLVGEVAAVLRVQYPKLISAPFLSKLCTLLEKVFCHPVFSRVLALLGFFAITMTGLLGGVMVYGVTADPLANSALKLLGITL